MPERRLQKTRDLYRPPSDSGLWERIDSCRRADEPVLSFEWSKVVTVELDIEEPTAETPWAV